MASAASLDITAISGCLSGMASLSNERVEESANLWEIALSEKRCGVLPAMSYESPFVFI